MEPDVVVISGDLTSNGFKDEYALAREYLNRIECGSMVVIPGNHDSRNVGYVHFEDLFGDRNSVLNVGPATIVAVDSSEPDLDNGQVGRGRYRLIEEAFAGAADLRVFVLHHHLLPVPGTGRERNIVHDAGDTLEMPPARRSRSRPRRPQARPVRVAARGSLRRQRRHGLVLAAARQGKALLQRRRGRRARTWTSGAAIRSTSRSGSSSSRPTRRRTRSTRRGSRTRCARRERAGARPDRR